MNGKLIFTFLFLLAIMAIIVASPEQVIAFSQGLVIFALYIIGAILTSWAFLLFVIAALVVYAITHR